MITNPQLVREKLREKVLQGYNPVWDYESAEDHWVDWLVLTREEFDAIKREALDDRRRVGQGTAQ